MTAASIIIFAEVGIAGFGIVMGLRYIVSGFRISLRALSTVFGLFCGTLVTASLYSNSLVKAAGLETVLAKKYSGPRNSDQAIS
jgi:hypothetical protein